MHFALWHVREHAINELQCHRVGLRRVSADPRESGRIGGMRGCGEEEGYT